MTEKPWTPWLLAGLSKATKLPLPHIGSRGHSHTLPRSRRSLQEWTIDVTGSHVEGRAPERPFDLSRGTDPETPDPVARGTTRRLPGSTVLSPSLSPRGVHHVRHSLRHRTLCALAALSLVLSVAPAPVAATAPEGDLPACAVFGGSSTNDAAGPEATPAATATGAQLDTGGLPCGPGPCSMPFTTCAAGGACLSMVPLPAGASPALSPDLPGVGALGAEGGLPSPASGITTPPPRS